MERSEKSVLVFRELSNSQKCRSQFDTLSLQPYSESSESPDRFLIALRFGFASLRSIRNDILEGPRIRLGPE
jgi:hypothetical protein